MKLFLAAIVCSAWICLASTVHVSIQDVKVVTPDGVVFEEIKKQETENGKVIRTETIRIKKPNKEETTECQDLMSVRQDAVEEQRERKKQLFANFMKHFRMAKLLHSLLSAFPAESAESDQPKHHHHHGLPHPHHLHRVFVIRIPLFPTALPTPTVVFPSHDKADRSKQTTAPKPSPESSSSSEKPDLPADRSEYLTTPSLPDQIPSPDVSGNQITDNEIPTD